MKKLLPLIALIFAPNAHAGDPAQDSATILQAALAQIQWTIDTHDTTTDCSTYVARTLDRAGFSVGSYSSNEFDQAMAKHLPLWKHSEFSTDNAGADQAALRNFLNGAPDGTIFLAQWPRVGRSGHNAIVEKVSSDQFMIFQAQRGLSLPHAATARVSQLLYSTGRANLRLFFE